MDAQSQHAELLNQITKGMQEMHTMLLRKFENPKAEYNATLMMDLIAKVNKRDEKETAQSRKETQMILYREFAMLLQKFFTDVIEKRLGALANAASHDFVDEYLKYWAYAKYYGLAYRMILYKHNRFYHEACRMAVVAPSMADCMASQWRNRVLKRYQEKILKLLTEAFEKERSNERIESDKIQDVFETIRACGLFELAELETKVQGKNTLIFFIEYRTENKKKGFAPSNTPQSYFVEYGFQRLLDSTKVFYQKKLKDMSQTPFDYILQSLEALKSEERRADQYLFEKKHKDAFLETAEKNLIDMKAEEMILIKDNGLHSWLAARNEEALSNMYKLYKRRSQISFPLIEKGMKTYFVKTGKEIVVNYILNAKKDPVQYIDDIVKLKQFCNLIVDTIFTKQEQRFSKMREEVFKEILKVEQAPNGKFIEFLAAKNLETYSNNKIKKAYTAQGEEEIFNNIILIFESLSARDSYLLELLRGMFKRLLEFYTSKAPRVEVDRKLIDRLKLIEGPKDLAPHEQMIKDLEASQEFQSVINDKRNEFAISLTVLTAGDWRKEELLDVTFPQMLNNSKQIIEDVYAQRNKGRALNWMLNKGVSRIEGKMNTKTFKFTLQNAMMVVLLHLDETPQKKMIYGDLKVRFKPRRVNPGDDEYSCYKELMLSILTLVELKLVKRVKELDSKFEHEEMLEINRDFVYAPKKGEEGGEGAASANVTIAPNLRLLKEEPQSNKDEIMIMRKERIKASIVTIMKQAKTCPFEKLQNDLKNFPKLLNVDYNILMLKECVDKLITDNFLARDPKDRNLFTYLPE